MRVFVVAEIGINHNGDINIAKQLIDGAVMAGCDAVKFQKRTIELVYTTDQLRAPRESPWGTTFESQKRGLELSEEAYNEIDRYCKSKNIEWFASAWDYKSQEFLRRYSLKYNKVASAMLDNTPHLKMIAEEKKHTFISTGMSTIEEIMKAVSVFKEYNCPFELMHTNSAYPMKNEDANLLVIKTLASLFNCDVGYSGHETGRIVSLAAVTLGATSIERHITLDKTMYGSDQAASLEIEDLIRLVRDIRTIEKALGDGIKTISPSELAVRKKLRGY